MLHYGGNVTRLYFLVQPSVTCVGHFDLQVVDLVDFSLQRAQRLNPSGRSVDGEGVR